MHSLTLLLALFPAQVEKPVEMTGFLQALDAERGTLEIVHSSGTKFSALNLASKKMPVTDIAGRPANLRDIPPGLRVRIKVLGTDVVSIDALGPSVQGPLKSLDLQNGTLTLTEFADRSFSFPNDVAVFDDDKPALLEKLRIKQPVRVELSLDRTKVLQIKVGKLIGPVDYNRRFLPGSAILTSLDPKTREFQTVVLYGDTSMLKQYRLEPDAPVEYCMNSVVLGKMPFEKVGLFTKVAFNYEMDTRNVVSLKADLPMLHRRKVVALDADKKELTVMDSLQPRTLKLADNVHVHWSSKKAATLKDVRPNQPVDCGFNMERTQVMALVLWK